MLYYIILYGEYYNIIININIWFSYNFCDVLKNIYIILTRL